MEKLNLFFSKIRELTFWQRLFSWGPVRNLSYDAFQEFKSFQKEAGTLNADYNLLEKKVTYTATQNEGLLASIHRLEQVAYKKEEELSLKNNKIDGLNSTIAELN